MHNRDTSWQSSRPPAVPDGLRVYAIGDVHGRDDLLTALLARITDDLAQNPIAHCQVVFLGDYVDRGPASRTVIERLLGGPGDMAAMESIDWICLRGNHEDQALRFLTDLAAGEGWLRNGGLDTILSYAGTIPRHMDGDMAALQMLFSRTIPPAHVRFLARLPLWHSAGDYLFVHAGVRPRIPLHKQNPKDMQWIRHEFLNDTTPHEKMIVHGHSITDLPDLQRNRIGIDTGAYYSGRLTCLVLQGTDQRFLSTVPL